MNVSTLHAFRAACTLSVMAAAGPSVAADPVFVIAIRGQPATATIVLPAAASPSQTYAAEELQKFTAEMTGVTLPIADDTGPLPEHAILLGDTRHTAAVLGMSPEAVAADREGFGDDGFHLRTAGGHLCVLAGPVRGTLYGVNELLERYGGCRWYASWHTVIPQLDRFAVPALDDRQRPAFAIREPYWMDMRQGDFTARSRVNGSSMQLDAKHGGKIRFGGGLFVHTFERLCPPAEFFQDHPEYFSEIDGVRRDHRSQLCLTNPDVERIVTERLLAIIRKDPGGRIVSVSQNDWAFFCTCPACKAIDDREESHAGTMIDFVNRVAATVEQEFPDVLVETLAYQYTRKPPKTVRPRRNVVPRLCSIECDFSRPIPGNPNPNNTSFRADMAGWAAISPQLLVWDYTTNFSHYLSPFPNVLALQGNVQFFRDNRVLGVFEQGAGNSRLADFCELKAWLLAKWLWNPDLPAEPLLDDFFAGFYGAAAPIVRRYFNEVHAFHDDPVSKPLGCFDRNLDVIPASFFAAADEQFAAAERAVADSPQHLHNVRRARVAVVHARLAREPGAVPRTVWVTREPEKFALPATRRDLLERLLAGIAAEPDILTTEHLDGHRGRIAGWEAELATRPGLAADRALIEEGNFNLHRPSEWGEILADPAAGNGSSLKLFGSHFEWAATLPLEAVAFDPGVRYRLRLRVRVELEPGRAGEAFWAGIYDYMGKQSVISMSRSVAEAAGDAANAGSGSAGDYVWHDLGSWTPADGQVIWIGPGRFQEPAGSAVQAVWIDCLEIKRE